MSQRLNTYLMPDIFFFQIMVFVMPDIFFCQIMVFEINRREQILQNP